MFVVLMVKVLIIIMLLCERDFTLIIAIVQQLCFGGISKLLQFLFNYMTISFIEQLQFVGGADGMKSP